MEFFCHYCHDWYESEYCQSHFENVHNQKDVTFEKLKTRMEATMGGLSTREAPAPETETSPQSKNWLFREKGDEGDGTFVTNNFKHQMR